MIYTIKLNAEELSLIGHAIDLMPHGKVSKLAENIQQQINIHEATVLRQAQLEALEKEVALREEGRREALVEKEEDSGD